MVAIEIRWLVSQIFSVTNERELAVWFFWRFGLLSIELVIILQWKITGFCYPPPTHSPWKQTPFVIQKRPRLFMHSTNSCAWNLYDGVVRKETSIQNERVLVWVFCLQKKKYNVCINFSFSMRNWGMFWHLVVWTLGSVDTGAYSPSLTPAVGTVVLVFSRTCHHYCFCCYWSLIPWYFSALYCFSQLQLGVFFCFTWSQIQWTFLPFICVYVWEDLDRKIFVEMVTEKLQVVFWGNFSFFVNISKCNKSFSLFLQYEGFNSIL